jgi:NAD(P)-dependent dehydrogenase (short-subunit alcohol dehydrogenase family)
MADITIYPSLRDKVVLITGGADGIGAAAVELFCRQNARVVFLDIDTDRANALIDRLRSELPSVPVPQFKHCDVTNLDRLKTCAEETLAAHEGRVDVLVNNAFGSSPKTKAPTSEITPESFDFDINASLRHQFFLTQYIVPSMRSRGSGSIVNMGSITWRIPATDVPVYSTAKAAVLGMTRVHAREFGVDGVRVNSVMPGSTATRRQRELVLTQEYEAMTMETQAIKRVVEPIEVARVILFLASDDASAVTGGSHVVDGGWVGDT